MGVSLDDPIEYLKLSNRTRNALRRMGCATLGSVMNRETGPVSHRSGCGFGPVYRAEVARALAANGFTSWAELMLAKTGAERLAALRVQMEASFRQWTAQIENLETCVRNPGESERAPQRRSGAATKGCAEFAAEFRERLTVICAASAGLLQTKTLSPEQRELAELIETESVRLRELLPGLLDTSRVKTRSRCERRY